MQEQTGRGALVNHEVMEEDESLFLFFQKSFVPWTPRTCQESCRVSRKGEPDDVSAFPTHPAAPGETGERRYAVCGLSVN